MTSRRRWLLVLAVVVALLALVWGWRSDDYWPRDVLTRTAKALSAEAPEDDAARRSRLDRELPTLLTNDVRVAVPGLYSGNGLGNVTRAAVALAHDKHPFLALSAVEVRVLERTRATATFRVTASDSQNADLHARVRNGRASLVKTTTGWRVESIVIEAETAAEPEPRP